MQPKSTPIEDLIIRGGVSVSPASIEEVVRRVKGVRDAAVIGVPDEFWGVKIGVVAKCGDNARADAGATIDAGSSGTAEPAYPPEFERVIRFSGYAPAPAKHDVDAKQRWLALWVRVGEWIDNGIRGKGVRDGGYITPALDFVSGTDLPLKLEPHEAYFVVMNLLMAFGREELRITKVLTAGNLDHAKKLEKRARSLNNALKKAQTAEICHERLGSPQPYMNDNGKWYTLPQCRQTLTEQLHVAEEIEARFRGIAEELECKLKLGPRCRDGSALEAFVGGQLAEAFHLLFGRVPAKTGRPTGPFPRFGERFFALVGHSVERSTIASALKGRANHQKRERVR